MNRHTAILIAVSSLTLDMSLAPPAAAQPALLPVYLTVSNQVAVPTELLAGAVAEVRRIYATIGVTVVWTDEASNVGGRRVFLNIVSASRLPSRKSASTLGAAHVGGILAYVAFERVERFAAAWGNDVTTTLGLTIAHEVGHLLLGHGSHGETGLMSAVWNSSGARLAAVGQLLFTPAEAARIRNGLAVRR